MLHLVIEVIQMSRIGKRELTIPAGVTVTVASDNTATVKGPLGTMSRQFDPAMKITIENNTVTVARPNDLKRMKMIHGTTNAHLNNMIQGVVKPFEKTLIIEGVGCRANLKGETVVFDLGYSHPIEYTPPQGIKVVIEGNTTVKVSGMDKELVGQEAAHIRKMRKPIPYVSNKTKAGRGIKYADEVIRKKVGKKA